MTLLLSSQLAGVGLRASAATNELQTFGVQNPDHSPEAVPYPSALSLSFSISLPCFFKNSNEM